MWHAYSSQFDFILCALSIHVNSVRIRAPVVEANTKFKAHIVHMTRVWPVLIHGYLGESPIFGRSFYDQYIVKVRRKELLEIVEIKFLRFSSLICLLHGMPRQLVHKGIIMVFGGFLLLFCLGIFDTNTLNVTMPIGLFIWRRALCHSRTIERSK